MSEENKAGHLILSQLRMFNEAVILFENVVSPAIEKGLDNIVESFADDNNWDGKFEFASEDADLWVAPNHWIINPGEKKLKPKAWFGIDYIDGDNDSWVALLCGVASHDGQAGFMFSVDHSLFGGKVAWNTCAKKLSKELISRLTSLGFQNRNNGEFFLPVTLNNQLLAQSWLEFGEFTKDDDSLIPLREALEKLKQAVPIFDHIMQNCAQTT